MSARATPAALAAALVLLAVPVALHAQKPKLISADSARRVALVGCPKATCSLTTPGKLTKLSSGAQAYVFTTHIASVANKSIQKSGAPIAESKTVMIDATTGKVVTH
ncbi:MAG TPA: hypothetical protein VHW65_01665 [Gemmatimonadales bacterium]|jgi:hypothetical protein|nr:hypothetical protein [Gemmatimonadales bacterium]